MLDLLRQHACLPARCTSLAVALATVAAALVAARPAWADEAFGQQVRPFLLKFCHDCHSGPDAEEELDLSMEVSPKLEASNRRQIEVLRNIAQRLRGHTMPPEDFEPQPSGEETKAVLAWIDAQLNAALAGQSNPGHVTIRRLTRIDYRNTIRDLFGMEIDTSDFPSDDVAHGFDNLADVISLPPLLMDRYVQAAEQVVEQARARHFAQASLEGKSPRDAAQQVLAPLIERAFRRPVAKHEVERYAALVEQAVAADQSLEDGLALAMQAVLISPHFLYRIEDEGPIGQDHPIDEFELATRLSYFLWSSMPDDALFQLARQGKLRAQLPAQVKRMLQDDKVRQGLVENFAGQWLQTRRLQTIAPDPELYPDFDEALRAAMARETELLFEHIVQQDRSVLELIGANYTFVNERLARHYGIKGVQGDTFRQVSLEKLPRRGLLTQAAVLAINSHPNRTSPVKRGKWIMEAILGTSPPPPPPDVPALEEVKVSGTLRERLEQHRSNPRCAGCHQLMDPLGLAMENFDAVGRWRTKDEGHAIDASGKLPGGATFANATELAELLQREKADPFRRNLARQLMIYATGRTLDYYDEPVVDRIVREAQSQGDRFSSFVLAIVQSDAFQKVRNPAAYHVASLPGGANYEFSGNPAQQAQFTLLPAESEKPAADARGEIELHTLHPLLRASAPQDAGAVKLTPLQANTKKKPLRYRLDVPVGKPVYLFFVDGIIAPYEYSDDFRMPIADIPPTAEGGEIPLAECRFIWGADLTGPRNPRPGTIYSFTYRVQRLASEPVQTDLWLIANASNRSMFIDSGAQTTTEPEQVMTQVGRRSTTMLDGYANTLKLALRAGRGKAVVRDISPIRFVRPKLGLSSTVPIRFAKLKPGQASEPSAPYKILNAQKTTLADSKGEAWKTILYGTARLNMPEPKKPYLLDTEHVGAVLVGEAADKFELVGDADRSNGKQLKLIGADGEPGLLGGPQPESETFRVRFRGAKQPGIYQATVRVVTQSGGVGTLSDGGPKLPHKGLYYVDIPIEAEVAP